MLIMYQALIHLPQGERMACTCWEGAYVREVKGWELGRQAHTFSVGHRQGDLHASSGLGLAEGRSARASTGKPWPLRTHRNARLPCRARLGGGASAMSIDMICNNGKALAKDTKRQIKLIQTYSNSLLQYPSSEVI